jgi:hypothetical protein
MARCVSRKPNGCAVDQSMVYVGVRWCKSYASKAAKSLASLQAVMYAHVRFRTTLHA